MRLVLESCKVNISLYQPARIFFFPSRILKAYIDAWTGFSHIQMVSTTPYSLKAVTLKQLLEGAVTLKQLLEGE